MPRGPASASAGRRPREQAAPGPALSKDQWPTGPQETLPLDETTKSHWEPDQAGYTAAFSILDRAIHASLARYTLGLSPRAMMSAYFDWAAGILFSPGKQAQLVHKAQRKWIRYAAHVQHCLLAPSQAAHTCCIEPLPQDRRFDGEDWQKPPFNFIYQAFLLTQQWWHNATTGVSGVTPQNERAVEFAARQLLDVFSPSNFVSTNPEILNATLLQGGQNLLKGWQHLIEDLQAQIAGKGPVGSEAFKPGKEVAVTPGKVVYRNRLIELIQYAPATAEVHREPILIIPAWIMKYYILDLSPTNSLVRHLVEQGFTVFMISWKNPGPDDRELDMDDYRRLGPTAALDVIGDIVPEARVHAVGYCLGGTLLAIMAAAMAQVADDRLKSLTFLAAQIDFEEAGELMLFINEKQIAFLDDLMWEQGFLDTKQMAGAFQLLRSNDLIWSRMVREYLMGERAEMSDLMAWNADGTRMPYRMHSEYLTRFFLKNDLAGGRYDVDGRRLSLSDIRLPSFVVGTQKDHVAPWRSVYKFHRFTNAELTFLLTSGGHNAGIVSEPGHLRRSYQISTTHPHELHVDPETWLGQTPVHEGSWWNEWLAWLRAHSGPLAAPPEMGSAGRGYTPLGNAPGTYVLMP
ncbi:MAG TPA: alpha/beta fold hydrolase [Sinorhizobium sp.]|nr:alpha/beta fold hydrolase [Sinorhizobium sp.]